ncbi:hypothetical protein Ndes2526B_g04226 [Nannochloris sp. 'desiccata']|nr:hypothetical protein KSW81_001004 [Chlorella desiccata (nom. nud.)]KAH7620306.1 hypothetical protein NADE_002933 [Chlorella desiccata (nom. nud.)]
MFPRLFLIISVMVAVSSPPSHLARAAPLPPNGVFPNSGFPKYIESGWVQIENPKVEAHVSILYNGQAIAQILKDDGNLSTRMMNITSYECLDSNTYRYIANEVTYPEKTSATICVTEFANATHRFSAVLPNGGNEGCPDSPFAAAAAAELDDPNSSDQTHFVFLRQEGVLPAPPEIKCINQSNPYIPPLSPIPAQNQPNRTISDSPYSRTYGSPVGQGVWKSNNLLVLENQRYYAAIRLVENNSETREITPTNAPATDAKPGNLYALIGVFFSHYCLSPTNFASTSAVTRIFNNGTIDYGTACQNGTRNSTQQQQGEAPSDNGGSSGGVEVLNVEYAQGPNCNIWSSPDPTDVFTTENFSLELVQPLSSDPETACVFAQELEPPVVDTETPSNSGNRVVVVVGAMSRVKIAMTVLSSFAVVAYFC